MSLNKAFMIVKKSKWTFDQLFNKIYSCRNILIEFK